MNELKIMSSLNGALKALHRLGESNGHEQYGHFQAFAEALQSAGLDNWANKIRAWMERTATVEFWKEVSLFDPRIKEKYRAAGTISELGQLKQLRIPAIIAGDYSIYIKHVEQNIDTITNVKAAWEVRNCGGEFKRFVQTLLNTSSSTRRIESVFSTLECVDDNRATNQDDDTLILKTLIAANKTRCPAHLHQPRRRGQGDTRQKRNRDDERVPIPRDRELDL